MKEHTKFKKILSVVLSVAMIAGLITVSEPREADAADAGVNLLANGDFASADSAWMDQDGTLVPAQTLVDDVKVTVSPYRAVDFESYDEASTLSSLSGGWNLWDQGSYFGIETVDGSKVLRMTKDNDGYGRYLSYYGADVTEGTTYRITYDAKASNSIELQTYIAEMSEKTAHVATLTTEWQTITKEFTSTETYSTPSLYFNLYNGCGYGTVYIDNLKVEIVTKTENMVDSYSDVYSNNFAGASPTHAWNIDNTTTSVVTVDGNQVLSFVPGTNNYITYYGCSSLVAGETYRLSCKVYSDTEISFRLYDAATNSADHHTVSAGSWSTFTVNLNATATSTTLYFGFMDETTGTAYIDDVAIEKYEGLVVGQTYSEGIGTCNDTEESSVLVMEDYTKATQPITIMAGNVYDYSFKVKSEETGSDFNFGVTAGNNATEAVTVTPEWTEITGSFRATAEANEFGFIRTGAGKVFVDDVVLYETSATPSDHTSIGAYVPEGQMNLLSGAVSDFSSTDTGYSLGSIGSIADGMLKIVVNGEEYVQSSSISVSDNETYLFSCYVWVTDATEGLDFNIFRINGAGLGWQDNACTTISSNTGGWILLTYEFSTTSSGTIAFGFKNYGTGAGTIYVDDVALTKAKTVVTDHTTMENGGDMLPEGATNLISNGDFGTAGSLGNGVTAAEGIAFWSASSTSNYYQVGIQATAGHSYRVSYFVQICEAGMATFDMFMSGAGSATGGWKDYVLQNSASISNISNATHNASIVGSTDGWQLVEYTWTAPADGEAYIGFKSYVADAAATIYLDDLVVYDVNYTPTDHTIMEGGGYYIVVEDAVNLNGVGAFSDSSGWNGSGYEITGGMGILDATDKYLQTTSFSLTQGHTYTMSAYVWVTEADSSLSFDWFSDGAASPKAGWLDYGMREWSNWVSKSNVSCNRTNSMSSNTYGWELVTVTWTAPADGNCYFGFKIYGGTGTVYVDDVAIYDHEVAEVLATDIAVSYSSRYSDGTWYFAQTGLTVSETTHYKATAIIDGNEVEVPIQFTTDGSMTIWPNFFTVYGGTAPTSSIKIEKDTIMKQVSSSGWGEVPGATQLNVTNDVHIYLNEYQQWVDPSNTDIGEACDLTFSWFDYYSEKMAAFGGMPQSSGNYVALSGAVQVNGTNYGATFTHNETSVTFTFASGSLAEVLSKTEVNKVVIPKGLVLYNGTDAVCHMNSETVFYVQYLQGQWLSWTSEYVYEGENGAVQYHDMGTADTEYVFNNNADATYIGVLTVSGQADIGLGGQTSASEAVTELGDYHVVRTIKGEKYDYTVALYKRGDADKTQDGRLTAKDLVASKWAVQTTEEEFGHARYKAADSNTDGAVNEEDAAFMRYILVHDYDITTTTSKGYSTLGQGVMPIVGYGGPTDDTTKQNNVANRSTQGGIDNMLDGDDGDKVFGLIKELGINVFSNAVHQVGDDYNTSTRMLKQAEKYGLGIYINNAYISNANYVGTQLPIQTAKYDSFASFHGYYVADEPENASDISNYTTQLTALKNHVNIASYFNLSPLRDSNFSTTTAYENYLKAALATGAESLQYDMYLRGKYTLWNDKIKTDEFYENLDIARTQSMNYKKPFQAWVQTGANWIDTTVDGVSSSNRLTVQEMYLEANAALAMGAKGIHYFTLVESVNQVAKGDNDSGLITIRGEANNNEGGKYAYYNAAKKINTYITTVDEVLMNATSKGVVTTNTTVKGYIGDAAIEATSDAAGVLKEITGSAEAFVGCFDYYGKDAYLVVNITPDDGTTGSEQSITLNFDKEVTYSYTFMDGTTGTATGSSATGKIPSGESVLVVVE